MSSHKWNQFVQHFYKSVRFYWPTTSRLEISAAFDENTLQLSLHDNGTGLGFEITLSLLKAYGGKIELAESGEGALFVLSLTLSLLK